MTKETEPAPEQAHEAPEEEEIGRGEFQEEFRVTSQLSQQDLAVPSHQYGSHKQQTCLSVEALMNSLAGKPTKLADTVVGKEVLTKVFGGVSEGLEQETEGEQEVTEDEEEEEEDEGDDDSYDEEGAERILEGLLAKYTTLYDEGYKTSFAATP